MTGGAMGGAGAGNALRCELELLDISDAYIDALGPAGNNGQVPILAVTRRSASASTRALVKFDLAASTQAGVIQSAELRLVVQSNSFDDKIIAAHRVASGRPWSELGVSWSQYVEGAAWGAPGADFVPAEVAETLVSRTKTAGDVVALDVTDDVIYFQQHPEEYFGWLIKDAQEPALGTGEVVRFESREGTQSPRLVLRLCE